jgi:hypothetical protein
MWGAAFAGPVCVITLISINLDCFRSHVIAGPGNDNLQITHRLGEFVLQNSMLF